MEKNSSHIGLGNHQIKTTSQFFHRFCLARMFDKWGQVESFGNPSQRDGSCSITSLWAGLWQVGSPEGIQKRQPWGKDLQGTRKHNILSFETVREIIDSKVTAGDVLILGSVPSSLQTMSQFMRQVEFSRKELSTFMIGGSRMVIDHLMSYTS